MLHFQLRTRAQPGAGLLAPRCAADSIHVLAREQQCSPQQQSICGPVLHMLTARPVVVQAAFFTAGSITAYDSYKWMGVMALLIAGCSWFIYFPMWGGMVCPAKAGVSEQVRP